MARHEDWRAHQKEWVHREWRAWMQTAPPQEPPSLFAYEVEWLAYANETRLKRVWKVGFRVAHTCLHRVVKATDELDAARQILGGAEHED